MNVTKTPAVPGSTTVVISHEDEDALYGISATYNAFIGSDEWDLNDAWRSGFMAALECIFGGSIPEYLTAPQDEDEDEVDVDFGPMPEQTLDGINA